MIERALSLANVTLEDFKNWCKENKKSIYKSKTKEEFFKKIIEGKLVRDKNGNLVKNKKVEDVKD